ncbi:MAG: homoserine kinase [Clostridia bacterium]|nr:homoserine kinase [Clostridia bacterium]
MVRVKVPATSANLGPGFDTLGMALDLYNYVELEVTENHLVIEIEGEGAEDIPLDQKNIVYQAAARVFERVGFAPKGVFLKLINHIPVARGLGSSAAAIVGGILAANHVSGNKLTLNELLAIATEFEGHPDNVAPAIFGGIIISAEVDGEILWQKIKPQEDLKLVIAIPEFTLSTKLSRQVLPEKIIFSDAVFNISRVGMVIMALSRGDYKLLTKVMDDKLHQPYRNQLVPGMIEVFKEVKNFGYPIALSGAGPTLISFCDGQEEEIGQIMADTFKGFGVKCRIRVLSPNNCGAEIVET